MSDNFIELERLRDKKFGRWPALVEMSPAHYDNLLRKIESLTAQLASPPPSAVKEQSEMMTPMNDIRANQDYIDHLKEEVIRIKSAFYASEARNKDCEDRVRLANKILTEAWMPEHMCYDTQGVNQAHRILNGGVIPMETNTQPTSAESV